MSRYLPIVALLLTAGCPQQDAQQPQPQQPPQRVAVPTAPTTPDVTITAMQLWKDYDANEVAADNKYKGKWLLVSGEVDSVTKDFSGWPYIILKSPNLIMRTPVRFSSDQTTFAAGLQKGQTVSTLCRCRGQSMGSPDLVDCVPR